MLLSELASRLGLEHTGDDRDIDGVSTLESAGVSKIAFLSNPKYAHQLATTKAGCVLIDRAHAGQVACALVSDRVKEDLARVVEVFARPQGEQGGISELAFVHPEARLDGSVTVYPFAFIGPRASLGPGCRVFPGCYVGEDCVLGRECTLYPNVSLMAGTVLGDRVAIHAGSVLGADGYGYAQTAEGHRKIPQIGRVVIEDDVEIGANACIDRASLDETRVGRGTKIDNLVQLAHNVRTGQHCLIVSQVGVAGSSRLGNGVVLAGQAGIKDNIELGDGVIVGAQGGVQGDLPPGSMVSGSPAMDMKTHLKCAVRLRELPDLFKRMKKLEKRIAELEEKEGA